MKKRKNFKHIKLIIIIILILLCSLLIVKIEKDWLSPFNINVPDLNYQFFTSSECIRFHPLYIDLYREKGKMGISTTFDKVSECLEDYFTIDVSIHDGKKYIFEINDKKIINTNGKIFLTNEDLLDSANSLSVDIYGIKDYYIYYNFKSLKTKIAEIEFNILNKYLCEGDCVGVRKGNILDANNINGRSITFKINDSEIKFIFIPKRRFLSHTLIILHGLLAGLFLLLLQKIIRTD